MDQRRYILGNKISALLKKIEADSGGKWEAVNFVLIVLAAIVYSAAAKTTFWKGHLANTQEEKFELLK